MSDRKRLLFICGSINQTTQMHQIARELPEHDHAFSPCFGNRDFEVGLRLGVLESTIGGNTLRERCFDYLRDHDLPVDDRGASRGVRPEKMVVTGIPNLDDCARYQDNESPHRGHVLCCTSDVREVFGSDDRKGFIDEARRLAAGRPLFFKLHPNEKLPRALAELARWAPEARVFTTGNAEEMVANCDVLLCKCSSLAYVGVALGKEVHSFFPDEELRRLLPLQHGRAAANIAAVARDLLGEDPLNHAPTSRRTARRDEAHA